MNNQCFGTGPDMQLELTNDLHDTLATCVLDPKLTKKKPAAAACVLDPDLRKKPAAEAHVEKTKASLSSSKRKLEHSKVYHQVRKKHEKEGMTVIEAKTLAREAARKAVEHFEQYPWNRCDPHPTLRFVLVVAVGLQCVPIL